jgi:exonuclease III
MIPSSMPIELENVRQVLVKSEGSRITQIEPGIFLYSQNRHGTTVLLGSYQTYVESGLKVRENADLRCDGRGRELMRIAAWNIQNGGGKRIDGISRALSAVESDVCVLSEYTNAASGRLTSALKSQGYAHILNTEPESRWGGILVASRMPMKRGDIVDCPSPERWLHVVFENVGLEIGAAYIPNSERSKTEKTEYWNWLIDVGGVLVSRTSIVCGDFNTGLPYVDEKGSTLKCSAQMSQMLESQWTDLWRITHPRDRESSWWSNIGNGFRLDHAFGSPTLVSRSRGAEYVTMIEDQCVTHESRTHVGCERRPLSDHSMLTIDLD